MSRSTSKLKEKPANILLTNPQGFSKALELFHVASARVPAYKDFLAKHKIKPREIRTYQDFQRLPIKTKQNYFTQYSLADLALDGDLSSSQIISMSSGSTGEPFLWPRGKQSTNEAALILDELYEKVYGTKEKTTLCIVAYAMGTWIAGTYMVSALHRLAERGHKIVSITPGINQEEIIQILKRIGKDFDQILIMGYAPFLKDMVDLAAQHKLNLAKLHIKFMFSSEHISERWRRYVLDEVKRGYDASNSLCLYGAAEVGIIGMETPLIIRLRQCLAEDSELFAHLFPDTKILPTLTYYEPSLRFVEEVDSHLIFTVNNTFPLIRYDLKDEGRLLSQEELLEAVRSAGHEVPSELFHFAKKPLIALYGRSDVAAMFYGVNVYPENIRYALELPAFQPYITNKFVVKTEFDKHQEQSLHILIELKKGVVLEKDIADMVHKNIIETMKQNNSEYRKLSEVIKQKASPHIGFVEYGKPEFHINRKHRWVLKS